MQIFLLCLALLNISIFATPQDTSKKFSPFIIGNLTEQVKKENITENELERFDFKNTSDIFNFKFNFLTNEISEAGGHFNLNFNFKDMRSVRFLLNGRDLNSLLSPYPFITLPLDQIAKIEISKFPTTINFVSKNLLTATPITRIRYIEDAYNFTATDGTFSLNIKRNLNLTSGLRRTATDGRYLNSDLDTWTIFTNFFFIPNERTKINFTNIFSTVEKGLNGGIKPATDEITYNEKLAQVFEPETRYKMKRNDLTGTIQFEHFIFRRITLFNTLLNEKVSSIKNPNTRRSQLYGVKFTTQQFNLKTFSADLEFEFQSNELQISSDTSIAPLPLKTQKLSSPVFSTTLNFWSSLWIFNPTFYLEIKKVKKELFTNACVEILTKLKTLVISATTSIYHRVPSLVEQNITNSKEAERHIDYALSLSNSSERFGIEAKIYGHRISNSLLFEDSTFKRTNLKRTFFEVKNYAKVWQFNFEALINVSLNKNPAPYPKYFISTEFFYRGFLTKTLDIKAGIRGKISDKFQGYKFINHALIFTESRMTLRKFAVFDLFISGKIKNAVIFLTLANFTNEKYMTSAFYPAQDRSLKIGVIWTFFD